MKSIFLLTINLLFAGSLQAQQPSEKQLANWLKRFPAADTNKDGKLSAKEIRAFRDKRNAGQGQAQRGVARQFSVHPGWDKAPEFPKHALMYKSPSELA